MMPFTFEGMEWTTGMEWKTGMEYFTIGM